MGQAAGHHATQHGTVLAAVNGTPCVGRSGIDGGCAQCEFWHLRDGQNVSRSDDDIG
jgi:hypothetical protein